jgi:hypothetical protein
MPNRNNFNPRLNKKTSFILSKNFKCIAWVPYMISHIILLELLLRIPSIDVSSDVYESLYFDDEFQFGKLLVYLFMISTGFLYKTIVTFEMERKTIFSSRKNEETTYCYYILISVFLYFIGPNAVILGFSDEFDSWAIRLSNFLYISGYVAGIHFNYLDVGMLQKLSLSSHHIMQWGREIWGIFIAICVIVVGLLSLMVNEIIILGRLGIYIGIYSVIILIIAIIGMMLRNTHEIHFHHYILGVLFLPLTFSQTYLSSVLQGLCLGLYTDGVSRWGMDPLFEKK